MKAKHIIGVVLLLFVCAAFADDDGIAWDSLSASQREVLAPFSQDWTDIPAARRQHLVRGADRLATMSPEQHAEAALRFASWRALPGERRALIRDRYEIYRRLSPTEQRRIRNNYRRFNRMDHDRRQKMRERYRDMTPEQRQRMHDRASHRHRTPVRD